MQINSIKIDLEKANKMLIDFINYLRSSSDYKPSMRQSISASKLLSTKFFDKGYLTLEDFIKVIIFTTPPQYQSLVANELIKWFMNNAKKFKGLRIPLTFLTPLALTLPFIFRNYPSIDVLSIPFTEKNLVRNTWKNIAKRGKGSEGKEGANLDKSPIDLLKSDKSTLKEGDRATKIENEGFSGGNEVVDRDTYDARKLRVLNNGVCKLFPRISKIKELGKSLSSDTDLLRKHIKKISRISAKLTKWASSREKSSEFSENLQAGAGENLLLEWFSLRHKLKGDKRKEVKNYVKELIIDLSKRFLKEYLGSSDFSMLASHSLKPFELGDSFEDVDIEESIENILAKGKDIKQVSYEDFLVRVYDKGKRSVVILLDISGSMLGYKLYYMAICTILLLKLFSRDNVALAFFESNTYEVKRINERIDIDELIDYILELEAFGGTCISRALLWAEEQFSLVNSKEKILIILSDLAIYDFQEFFYVLERLQRDISIIIISPKWSFDIEIAELLTRRFNVNLLLINDWRELPKVIVEYFTQYFVS